MRLTLICSLVACGITLVFGDASISKFPNSLTLSSSFDPIKAAYWTGLPHHRRTPFSVSPDGKSAYLAYLDSTFKNIVVQQVNTDTFEAVGTAINVAGFEAGGLVAQDDGFALLATVTATGTTDLPPNSYPIVKLFRYKNGVLSWSTALNGPGVHASDGFSATPDANGDLVYSPKSGLYAAYFVVTAYTGWAAGHFGDSIQYVNEAGAVQNIPEASTWGCSHNTGIGFEAADAPPFASVCAEDHGGIWLNTDTRSMNGIKIANENVTNGASGEPMGGMSGSYSNLALFPSSTNYVFAWQSRGAVNLTPDSWMGAGFTQASPRWLNHNVAIATMSAKNKLTGAQASSVVGTAEGDSQVNWITKSETEDHQNIHVATFNTQSALVTWETLTSPKCEAVPLGCTGTYAGTSFQVIDSKGAKTGDVVVAKDVFVSGDIANVGKDKVCWPYVDMVWDLSQPKSSGAKVSKMSFACASLGGDSGIASSTTVKASSTVSAAASAAGSSKLTIASTAATTLSTRVSSVSSPVFVTPPSSSATSSKATVDGASAVTTTTPRTTVAAVSTPSPSSRFQTIRTSAPATTSVAIVSPTTTSPISASTTVAAPVEGGSGEDEGDDDTCEA